jgi:hypothetical protein
MLLTLLQQNLQSSGGVTHTKSFADGVSAIDSSYRGTSILKSESLSSADQSLRSATLAITDSYPVTDLVYRSTYNYIQDNFLSTDLSILSTNTGKFDSIIVTESPVKTSSAEKGDGVVVMDQESKSVYKPESELIITSDEQGKLIQLQLNDGIGVSDLSVEAETNLIEASFSDSVELLDNTTFGLYTTFKPVAEKSWSFGGDMGHHGPLPVTITQQIKKNRKRKQNVAILTFINAFVQCH